MKALGRLLGILVVLVIIVVGAGFFLLPKTATKQTTVEIDKPAASVYALLASAPAGETIAPGATETLKSATPPNIVVFDVAYADGTKGEATYTVTAKGDKASEVAVKVEKPLGSAPMDRLGGLTGAPVAPILDSAGTQLKTDAATLKDQPFAGLAYEIVQLDPKPFLYIEGQVPTDPAAIKEAVAQSLVIVNPIMARNGLQQDGQPMAVETGWTEGKQGTYSFKAGLPFKGTAPRILIGVKAGQTPAGLAIKVVYSGAEDQVLPTYDKMEALIAAGRLKLGQSFEVYNDDPTKPGGSVSREIYYLVTGDTSQLAKVAPPSAASAPPAAPAAAAAPATPAPAAAAPASASAAPAKP